MIVLSIFKIEIESLKSNDWDLVIWGISDYSPALIIPTAYGRVKVTEDGQHVKSAHVKTKPPTEDNVFVMTGNFSFGSINTYKKLYKEMIKRNIVINEEYYIDSMVGIALETGLSCRVIPIDAWLNWGTLTSFRRSFIGMKVSLSGKHIPTQRLKIAKNEFGLKGGVSWTIIQRR